MNLPKCQDVGRGYWLGAVEAVASALAEEEEGVEDLLAVCGRLGAVEEGLGDLAGLGGEVLKIGEVFAMLQQPQQARF